MNKHGALLAISILDGAGVVYRHNTWHPARTNTYQDSGTWGFASFCWLDTNLLASPAYLKLTNAQKVVLIAFIAKWGRHTCDGLYGGFDRAIPFSKGDARRAGVDPSTSRQAFNNLEKLGFVRQMTRGVGGKKGKRPKSAEYTLSDAWKATLEPVLDDKAATQDQRFLTDERNLPRRHDPRRLPVLMNLVQSLGESCIWGLYGELAVEQWFAAN